MSRTATPLPLRRPFKLGFLTHVHGRGDPRTVYTELIELFVAAEQLGYDGGWVAQHHLQEEFGRLPSPLVLLAAVAERTRHIELGTGVITLPMEDPLRLAEDVAVLDALARGRLQLGLGSGGANLDAFEAFGLDVEQRQTQFASRLDILQRALGGQPVLRAGSAGSLAELTLQPAASGLFSRLWHSHSSIDGAQFAASQGNGLLLGTAVHDPLTVQRPLAEAYLDAWQAAPARPAHGPRLGIVRAVFPARDKQTSLAEIAPDVLRHADWLARTGHGDARTLTPAQIVQLLNVHHGHPDEIIETLLADPALLGFADYFIPVVQSERSTLDQTLRRMRVVAEVIAPALGWQAATSPALA
jgi:alkanesulfonate monooxygenase SsuD/methylene tetrahydromethanopterin reductase-like flavin-dependent oxidoreductase (luciferase family)